ncbi:MAG TPA: HPF/RaiA family ribosome-associated protein [bacterium]
MRYDIHKGSVQLPKTLEGVIARKVKKVDERLKRYHPDAAGMEIHVAHLDKKNAFECSIQLTAFKETLHAKKSAPELRVAVDKSFDALMKALDHYRVKINKSLQA